MQICFIPCLTMFLKKPGITHLNYTDPFITVRIFKIFNDLYNGLQNLKKNLFTAFFDVYGHELLGKSHVQRLHKLKFK